MQALVLTYDTYHPLTHHMIATYEDKWPDHPFTFLVPYNDDYPTELTAEYGETVEPIHTDPSIRDTVLTLLENVPDEEWIYWAIDDKYLVDIARGDVRRLASWIENGPELNLDGLSFVRARYLLSGKALDGTTVTTMDGTKLYRRKDYSQIWFHQFLKPKVLKHLFENMPDPNNAKEMDKLKFEVGLPEEHRLYVTNKNYAIFGESSRRGKLTQNCAQSLQNYGIDPPEEMGQIDDEKIIGDLRWYRNLLFRFDTTRSLIWDR